MISQLTLAAGALGAAVSGGALYAFSSFVMPALTKVPTDHGIVAMQAINRAAPTPSFMVPLFGTTLVAVGLGVHALSDLHAPGARTELIGAGVYIAASLVTIGYHVPRNDLLAQVDAGSPEGARLWSSYVREWTAANHVRSVACLAAATLWLTSLWQRSHH